VDNARPRSAYRGSRRAPLTYRRRYLALLTVSLIAAALAAIVTGTAFPDRPGDYTLQASAEFGDLGGRQFDADRASRGEGYPGALPMLNQPAPSVWVLPIHKYTVTSYFGTRWGLLHAGVDLGAATGTPFFAAAAGRVVLARWNAGYGNNVMIDHGGGIMSVYGHSSKLLVKEGQSVRAGQLIALVGDTGHSFGSHLHFELRLNNRPIEPLTFMREHGVDIQQHTEAIYS
jgi:murein DD-endopeptidase MepM/ murein hydrolase activator NlpD